MSGSAIRLHRVHLQIQGRVQGVGFRYYLMRRAHAMNLNGWVRNLTNGDVELEAEGDRAALEQLVEQAGSGPTAAHVTGVRARWSEGPARFDRFESRADANPS